MRTEDGHIISECLNGEPAAFGLLVDKYKAGVYSLAFAKLGNFHDAQDITQEVFIKAFKNLHTLKRWDSFLSWLCSITTNLCNKFIRSQSRRPDREFIEDQESEIMDTFSTETYHNVLVDESVRDAFNSLPEIYRKVLSLYYLADMDSVEIAKYLGISPTAVRQRLSRARAELKEGVLAMLGAAFHEQRQERLQAEFTFKVVEAVKRINPNPISPTKGLPFGLSLATGIMLAVLGFGSHFSMFNLSFSRTGYLIPNEMQSSLIGNIPIAMSEPIPSFYAGGGNGGDKGLMSSGQQDQALMAPKGQGDGKFTNVTEEAGLKDASNGASTAWGDYDNDGDLDLYIGYGKWSDWWSPGPNQFYRNNGDGTFTDITKEIGLGDNIGTSPQSGFADYDNDGNLDFYLYNPIWGPNMISRIFLYLNNGKGKFTDITDKAGIKTPDNFFSRGGGFVDYNNDGNLDLFFSSGNEPDLLYRNNGDGTFTDVSNEVNLGTKNSGTMATWGDYDSDGDMDLFIGGGVFFGETSSFHENMGDGTFKDVTQNAGILSGSHSAVFLDYDNDGDLDIYTVDGISPSCLYRNNGNKTFTNVAWEAGVFLSSSERVSACDYDNDGYTDIYVMNWMDPAGIIRSLFHNNGDGTFTDVAKELGITQDIQANGCSFADYDNDGFLDLYSSSAWAHTLYHNDGNDNNWLKIKLVGSKGDIPVNIKRTNKDGIGSRITVQAGKLSMIRELNTGCARGYIPPIAHFGLGQNQKIDKLTIRWTSGQVTELQDIQANQFLVIKEGEGIIGTIEANPRPKGVESKGKVASTWGKLKENKLYQNFPNPFNPETWIPYQISNPSEVTIKIYEESGRLVRSLDLGIKKEGSYLSGSQSAYWDGKNEEGESVSSGVYFYTIKAGDFTDTKKMIVQK